MFSQYHISKKKNKQRKSHSFLENSSELLLLKCWSIQVACTIDEIIFISYPIHLPVLAVIKSMNRNRNDVTPLKIRLIKMNLYLLHLRLKTCAKSATSIVQPGSQVNFHKSLDCNVCINKAERIARLAVQFDTDFDENIMKYTEKDS